ncbi:uncharacterized protein LOC130109901 [Lampris incognitus]|uniref:uncharacterized protein LOC130109901 n=1 Tax=Lampris incognitus TaxID=2546036 RepID=UPI0024B622FF|nr:uncharacterized protein LOC130109901 [Lampris incognitus]
MRKTPKYAGERPKQTLPQQPALTNASFESKLSAIGWPPHCTAPMADSPLNNSWPSFSKLWMKRWSFKRASECKPCSRPSEPPGDQPYTAVAGTGSSSSTSPASIAEDVFFSNTNDNQDTCSIVSDYDYPGVDVEVGSSVEDLLDLNSSLRDSEYFKDLEGGESPSLFSGTTVPQSTHQAVGHQVSLNRNGPVSHIIPARQRH